LTRFARQQSLFGATVVLIEDKASGTQLIQELITEGCHGATRRSASSRKSVASVEAVVFGRLSSMSS
jgi:hypothetical protein